MNNEQDDIEGYREGSLPGAKRNALEKKALHDPFLADALEGAETVTPEEFSGDLRELSKKIGSRQANAIALPFRIAAGIAILLGASALFFYYFNTPQASNLALEKSSAAALTDSLKQLEKDSLAGLLSMAKPDKGNEESPVSTEPSPKGVQKKSSADDVAVADQSGEQPEVKLLEAETKADEEKSKTALSEIAEEKSEQLDKSVPTAASTGGAGQTKDESTRRSKQFASTKDKKETVRAFQNIEGTVTAADDGSALQGVNVIVKGSADGAVTDENGNYQLTTEEAHPQLVFSSIGLSRKEITVQPPPTVNVQLTPDRNQRSEVSVTGNSLLNNSQGQGSTELAQPDGGRDAFQKYLETSILYPSTAQSNKTEGSVTVQFTVNADGSLADFQVVTGIGNGCEDELIRVIKQGPSWTPTKLNKSPLPDKVVVQFRFLLPR